MAGVVMPQAKEKGGGLNKLMSGLQIAGAVTGIQNNMAGAEASKAATEAAGAAAKSAETPIDRKVSNWYSRRNASGSY